MLDDKDSAPANGAYGLPQAELDQHRRLRVLVVDDHDVIQWGFRLLLGSERWVQRYLSASNAEEALETAARYEPHVALVDMRLGTESGADLCPRLMEVSPVTRVLLMSGVGQVTVSAARSAGALGFVPKSWEARDIAGAARMVGLGMSVFVPVQGQPKRGLTDREREVLHLIADGASNPDIAQRLFLSTHTVKDHTRTLYRKLHAKNRADAIVRAQRMGLLD
ncbi:MAG TPA: response regulator transcription factor [Thermoleophilaceae bacterium]